MSTCAAVLNQQPPDPLLSACAVNSSVKLGASQSLPVHLFEYEEDMKIGVRNS